MNLCRPVQMVAAREVRPDDHLRDDSPRLRTRRLACRWILRRSQVCGEFSFCFFCFYHGISLQILAGLPDTIDTYGIVSGLWTSVFALGAFVGGEVHMLPLKESYLPACPAFKNPRGRIPRLNLPFAGPVAGGFLYDAVTFRWAIFMVK